MKPKNIGKIKNSRSYETNMVKHYTIRVFGRVQNINFRYEGKVRAEKLGLAGFIKNEPAGNVYIEAEGAEAALKKFLAWCHRGPALAQVTKVEITEADVKGYADFKVNYGQE